MSLTALVKEMEQEVIKQRQQEQTILQIIAGITSPEFAEQAADTLDSKKHSYSFETYLTLLERLKKLISAGIPNCIAIDIVQTYETDTETIISAWKLANAGNK